MASLKLGEVGLVSGIKWDLRNRSQIAQIIVSYGPNSLTSLQFHFLENGRVVPSEILGCQNFSGPMFDVITFEDPNEYITRVEGIYRERSSIDKLTLHTNRNVYDVFELKISKSPAANIKSFRYNFGGANQFGGFYGSHTPAEVTSIGFYFNYLTALPSSKKVIRNFTDWKTHANSALVQESDPYYFTDK